MKVVARQSRTHATKPGRGQAPGGVIGPESAQSHFSADKSEANIGESTKMFRISSDDVE